MTWAVLQNVPVYEKSRKKLIKSVRRVLYKSLALPILFKSKNQVMA